MSWSSLTSHRVIPLILLAATACGGTFETRGDETSSGGSSAGGAGGSNSGGTAGVSSGGVIGVAGAGSAGQGGGGLAGGGSTGKGGSGGKVTKEPTQHRPVAMECGPRPAPAPAGTGGSANGPQPPFQTCKVNADCTQGPNGRCVLGGRIGYACSYDACFGDVDCGEGAVCQCGTPDGAGNRCLSPGCAVDADCPNSWCSPTFGSCGLYSGVIGYACHTAKDECVNDADCGTPTGSGGYCMFDPMVTHWICSTSQCVG